MFTSVKLKNFRSLVDFKADFMNNKSNVQSFALIYGENGSGKTNLTSSIYLLVESISTLIIQDNFRKLINHLEHDENFKSIEDLDDLKLFIKGRNSLAMQDIIIKNKTVGSDYMELEYNFIIDNKKGSYIIVTDNNIIIRESLYFTDNIKMTNLFTLEKGNHYFNNKFFIDIKYKTNVVELVNQYWGKHSLLAIINSELSSKNEDYVRGSIINSVFSVIGFFDSISVCIVGGDDFLSKGILHSNNSLLSKLDKGTIAKNEFEELKKLENILNIFFTRLYSDVKAVYYKIEESDKLSYQLYFKKLIYGKILDINFSLESTGTKQLLTVFPFILSILKGNIVIIDDFDSGIHDILICQIMEELQSISKGQTIITTHNTGLLESTSLSNSAYILNVNNNANKELIPIKEFVRIHPNLNIRKKYLSGQFGAIPVTMEIDFQEIKEILEN